MKKSYLLLTTALLISSFSFSQIRPNDQRGLNVFEVKKLDNYKPVEGVNVKIGGNFTQSYQSLSHSSDGVSATPLNKLVPGFNLAVANMSLEVALAQGINLKMELYLSARHHQETWVKGGYIQFDRLPFMKGKIFDDIMKVTTIKVGHFEVNYGDAHFRRSDNGNATYNPFIENNIMDAFATEIGAEADVMIKNFTFVGAVTNGMIKGDILQASNPSKKHDPAIIGKVAFDKQFNPLVRFRLSGSVYYDGGVASNTLFGGDRGGSHYWGVLETANTTTQAFSGRFNPGFTDKITAMVGNAFIKVGGLESFTTLENAVGRSKTETANRSASQFATDLVFRFGKNEKYWVGGKYNTVSSELFDGTNNYNVNINRLAASGGWFFTKNIMAKLEYVKQNYSDGFLASDYRKGGQFKGFVLEAVVSF